MKSTRLVSHLAVAAVLPAAPVAWAQLDQSGGASTSGSGSMNSTAPGTSTTMRQGSASDTELQTRVKQALQQDSKLGTSDISVNAKNNIVYLTGKVDTRADRSHAVEVASRVDGVTKVEDKMSVGTNP